MDRFKEYLYQISAWLVGVNNEPVLLNEAILFFEKFLNISFKDFSKNRILAILLDRAIISPKDNLYMFKYGLNLFFKHSLKRNFQDKHLIYPLSIASVKAFTIDAMASLDIDDAMSVTFLSDTSVEKYQIGIHISNVDFFIRKNSELDLLNQAKGKSIYTWMGNYHLFPEELIGKYLSLVENSYHPCLSFYFFFDENYQLIRKKICCEYVYIERNETYVSVEEELKEAIKTYDASSKKIPLDEKQEDPLKEFRKKLYVLYIIALSFFNERKNKLGFFNNLFTINKIEIEYQQGLVSLALKNQFISTKSRFLVQQWMIFTNFHAALFTFTNKIPSIYYYQDFPKEKLDENLMDDPWILFQNYNKLQKSEVDVLPSYYASLGLILYTKVTSPIRRYQDLIVQRQICSFIQNGKALQYNLEEIRRIIDSTKDVLRRIQLVEKETRRFWIYKYLLQEKFKLFLSARILKFLTNGYLIFLEDYFIIGYLIKGRYKKKIGDQIKVELINVYLLEGKAYFKEC